ncbi:hypothetical protein AtubIFM54640_011265 [Aspergillus tubingensis]|nr:hypothetical protein AtubIFM54640_011265 [Aspergillus tubingensis]
MSPNTTDPHIKGRKGSHTRSKGLQTITGSRAAVAAWTKLTCTLILSRRGTYNRNATRDLRLSHLRCVNAGPPRSQQLRPSINTTTATASSDRESNTQSPPGPSIYPLRNTAFSPIYYETSQASIAASSTVSTGRLISTMFEDFMSWGDKRRDERLGLILLGEPSPLTFALEELPHELYSQLHDATSQILNSRNLEVIQNGIHPVTLIPPTMPISKPRGSLPLYRKRRWTILSMPTPAIPPAVPRLLLTTRC